MTVVPLTGAREAADLAAFLARLVRWDRRAVVRLQAAESALAVFGRPPFGDVLAVRVYGTAEPVGVDATVSAGECLEGVDTVAGLASVPPGVVGPSWAGVLPPRGGWQRVAELGLDRLGGVANEVIGEFKRRTEALPQQRRTRGEVDAIAEDIWSRPLATDAPVPLRAVHAAHALGLLRSAQEPVTVAPSSGAASPRVADSAVLFRAGAWLRLRTPYGSVAVRRHAGVGLLGGPVGRATQQRADGPVQR